MTILEFLLQTIEEGKELRIIYHGGSKPGEERVIIPRYMEGETLKAVDTKNNRVKSFSLKRIEILDQNNEVMKFDFFELQIEQKIEIIPHLTIDQIYTSYKDTLEGFGWQVFFGDSVDDYFNKTTYISLHDSFKNGKPKAKPTVLIYQSSSKHRPYGVGSERMDTRTYTSLENALKLFLEEAKNCEIKNPLKLGR